MAVQGARAGLGAVCRGNYIVLCSSDILCKYHFFTLSPVSVGTSDLLAFFAAETRIAGADLRLRAVAVAAAVAADGLAVVIDLVNEKKRE